jgi:hypothetical protein
MVVRDANSSRYGFLPAPRDMEEAAWVWNDDASGDGVSDARDKDMGVL